MPGRIDFTLGFNAGKAVKATSGSAYRIYIFGNFSGLSALPWPQRKIRRIDIDNYEQLMALILPTLQIGPGIALNFETLEDFHPDVWLHKIKLLADLLALKKQLANPNTAEQAAAKIQAYLPAADAGNIAASPAPQATESQEAMIERLLGKKPLDMHVATDTLHGLINSVVSPHVTRDSAPQHRALIEVIDTALTQLVKTLLHQPDFQNLEALWRATIGLLQEESADQQQIFLLDINQAELLAELKNGGITETLRQHIQSGDGEQQVLLVGDYSISDSADDRELLSLCSRLAHACDAYFLGGAGPSLISAVLEHSRDWDEYRRKIQADRVILAYPRVLMRLPYGKQRDPLEAFAFEECPHAPQPHELLWGNPAFPCARVLLKPRQDQTSRDQYFIADVPAFSYEQDGEPKLQPGTEVVLNESQMNALLSQGIVPVIGFHQRQGIRLPGLATLSD